MPIMSCSRVVIAPRSLRPGRLLPATILVRIFALAMAGIAVGAWLHADAVAQQTSGRSVPNIVVIMADDLGFSDIGCYGAEIETPHLDALAANGLRFTNFYNAARCCPTRAALLTGLYPHQAGIGHMTRDDGLPGYRGFLNDRCVTLAEVLREAGYATLTTGKWHVGSAPGQWPLDRGFDRFWGVPSGGGIYFKDALQIRKEVFFVEDDQRVEAPDDLYVTDTFTDYALAFIEQTVLRDQKPFFLYLAHIAPHWPLQAKPEDIAKYQGRYAAGWDAVRAARFQRQVQMGIVPPDTVISPRDPQAGAWADTPADVQRDLAHRMEIYAAQIDSIDQNVGRLLEKLETLQQLDNTLILFLSDNGCSAEGGPGGFSRGLPDAPLGTGLSYASAGLEWANVSDTPFRKFKMDTYEGGIVTPLVVHWPAGIAARGELRHQMGHVIDLMPTFAELAGVAYPETFGDQTLLPVEGISLVPAFDNRPLDRDGLFWEHQGNKAVRIGDWKAVQPGNGPWELYDLGNDRTERIDLADQHPKRLEELTHRWQVWAEHCGVWEWSELQRHRQTRSKGKPVR
ncbi:MAG: arylsulfatase [Planctomycetaceae bacterium]|nr:MAG: arylsulfatase [Planctomycetaceae bacterium]